MYYAINLAKALAVGDVISFQVKDTKKDKNIGLLFNKTAAQTSGVGKYVAGAGEGALSNLNYTVTNEDGLAGCTTIYFTRADGTSTNFNNLTITRPAAAPATPTFDPASGSIDTGTEISISSARATTIKWQWGSAAVGDKDDTSWNTAETYSDSNKPAAGAAGSSDNVLSVLAINASGKTVGSTSYTFTAPVVLAAPVVYALSEGNTFTSGQTVDVLDGSSVTVATITYGESGGAAFGAAAKEGSIYGYTATTAGNGTDGNKAGGTLYTIVPKCNAIITVGVALNADKKFYIEEDGVALSAYNGITVAAKYTGIYGFKAIKNKSYKIYCSGSKLGFYGFTISPYVDLSEESTVYSIAASDVDAKLTRTLSASYYNTFCVPFDIDLTDTSSPLYGADVQEFTAMDGNTLKFTAVTTTMVAGNPYLVKPAADVVNPVFTGVTVKAGAPAFAQVNNGTYDFKFQGTYNKVTLATDKTEQFLNTSGTFSYPDTDAKATMKGLRGYFIIPSEVLVGGAPEISISFDGDEEDVADDNTTVIDGIEYKTVKGGEFYNLNGQRVAQPTKGLYIMNGKKYVVK